MRDHFSTTIFANITNRGLAWHTDENALRQKFEEFGAVEEAVSTPYLSTKQEHSTNYNLYRSLSRTVTLDVAVVLASLDMVKNPMLRLQLLQ